MASPDLRIYVDKARRILSLLEGDREIARFDVAVGRAGLVDKREEGDGATPEGDFHVARRKDDSDYHLAFLLSYPNLAHAERGLRDGLIDEEAFASIRDAVAAGGVPPQTTRLGSWIEIHGDRDGRRDTAGCVVLENDEMDELWARCPVGTPVTIVRGGDRREA